jgi:hypothetical protein
MGGASSHFADTDWDKNDGGLRDASETLDGRPPTSCHVILTLKKENVVNQRDFEIRDDADEFLYSSKAIEGTSKWFDLLDDKGNKLFCIQTDSNARAEWIIYSYARNWAGQQVSFNGLYAKARIDITWNKYHGQVHLYSPSESNPQGEVKVEQEQPTGSILKCEEIKSLTAQFQSFVPSKQGSAADAVLHPPLAGWWCWEHTERRHQLKMHLCKGTDIALHCIVAIVCNMVNVEKQADNV